MLWELFYWEILASRIYVDVTFNMYLNVVAVHLFMATVFPNNTGLFQQENATYTIFTGMA